MHDSALVQRILSGDRRSGERFVTAHYPRIFRLLRCLAGSPDVAQDLTQQTFARAWQALPSFQGRASLATWLHKIAYHEYTNWLRTKRDHAPLDEAAGIADLREALGLDSILVSRALAKLTAEHREPFVLYYMQEFSVGEIAELLELPEGTIKSRLFTARRRLREMLQSAEAPIPASDSPEPLLILSSAPGGQR
ncbi:MAG TPA: RNA polymerase sigma factor [Chthonomonadaceae bacterium]|nr:RNA polymerase sigma factor [Chthonomonadaceae bacterium]